MGKTYAGDTITIKGLWQALFEPRVSAAMRMDARDAGDQCSFIC